MSLFYPLETLGNSSKNGRRLDYTQPTDSIYPILWGKKQTRFLAIYSYLLQIGSEKTARKSQEIYLNCLEADFDVQMLAYLIKQKFCQNCPLFTLLDYIHHIYLCIYTIQYNTIYIYIYIYIYKLQVYILYNIEIFKRQQSYWGTIIKRQKNEKLFTQRILYTIFKGAHNLNCEIS